MSNSKSIGQGVRGLRLPKIRGLPLTLNVALTTVLRTNVLHCDREIGVKVSKFLVVTGPLPTGHVTQRMRNGHFRPYNAASHYNGLKQEIVNVNTSNLSHC